MNTYTMHTQKKNKHTHTNTCPVIPVDPAIILVDDGNDARSTLGDLFSEVLHVKIRSLQACNQFSTYARLSSAFQRLHMKEMFSGRAQRMTF
jgi:hypothetical protein